MRRFIIITALAFLAVAAVIYGQAVWTSEFVRWDDGMLVFENPAIRQISPRTLAYIFSSYDPELYIPLTFLTYQIDYLIGGIAPFQYHLTSFLLHTANALLLGWFGMQFFRNKWVGVFLGLLFLTHPLHTEAVMWVSGRKDVLSTFFFLLTLVMWMKWKAEPVRRTFVLAVSFFALALLSKVMAITLPVLLLLIDWREKRSFSREIFTEKIPFFALAVLFGLIGLGGKTGVVASSTLIEKILMAGKSSLFYVRKILWPDSFSLLYPYNQDVVLPSPDFYLPIIFWLIIAIIVILTLKRTRDIAFGFLFYFVTVGPTFLNFTKGGDLDVYFASDRYAYVPSIGIFIAVIATVMLAARFVNSVAVRERIIPALGIIVIGVLSYQSHRQSRVWKNTETLLGNVLMYYPQTHVAHNNLGNVYRFAGEYEKAIVEYEKGLAIRVHPKTLSNLGAAYRRLKNYDKALEQYRKALEMNPNSREAHLGLGIVYAELQNFPLAEAEYRKSAEIDPSYEEAWTNLGSALFAQGKAADAVVAYRRALSINPFFTNAHYNLAIALTQMKDFYNAELEYEETIREAPTSIPPRINLGLLLHQRGDVDGAREQFEAILRIDPKNAAARSALRQMGG